MIFTAGIDLNTISDRMAIRSAIQRGDVEDGIERVNDLNPEVLMTTRRNRRKANKKDMINAARIVNEHLQTTLGIASQGATASAKSATAVAKSAADGAVTMAQIIAKESSVVACKTLDTINGMSYC